MINSFDGPLVPHVYVDCGGWFTTGLRVLHNLTMFLCSNLWMPGLGHTVDWAELIQTQSLKIGQWWMMLVNCSELTNNYHEVMIMLMIIHDWWLSQIIPQSMIDQWSLLASIAGISNAQRCAFASILGAAGARIQMAAGTGPDETWQLLDLGSGSVHGGRLVGMVADGSDRRSMMSATWVLHPVIRPCISWRLSICRASDWNLAEGVVSEAVRGRSWWEVLWWFQVLMVQSW